jgi:tetratricopeptide (TPR) repeat protein
MQVELDATDLKRSGLFVQTTADLQMDLEVEVFLRSDLGEVTVTAQVVQAVSYERAAAEGRRPGFGLLFTHLADDASAFIGLTLDAARRNGNAAAGEADPVRKTGGSRAKAARRRHRATALAKRGHGGPAPGETPVIRTDDPEVRELLTRLEGELDAARGKSPWALLELDSGADADSAKAAFIQASKRYHPHAYAHYDSERISATVTELFIAHKRAYTTIKRASLQPPPTEPIQPTSSLRPGNGRPSKDPVALLKEGLRKLARECFDEAERDLQRVVELDGDDRNARMWLSVCRGRKAQAGGDAAAAAEHYRQVLSIDPGHKEARKALEAAERPAGLLGKLFRTGNG